MLPISGRVTGQKFFILRQQNEKVDFSKCKGFLALHEQKFRYPKSMR
jgi:hypothetical protein